MPTHDYSAGEALRLLISNIEAVNKDLAMRIELAINEGKESQEVAPEPQGAKRRRKTTRYYRKNVPYTDEEAVQVALTVLKSHLLETRMFARAAHGKFFLVGVGPTRLPQEALDAARVEPPAEQEKKDKIIEIEMEPETVQSKKKLPNHKLQVEQGADIDTLHDVFRNLDKLANFG